MARPLRVLLLEDTPSDAELVSYELQRAGYSTQITIVENESDYRAHLHDGLDLILADFSLPQFNALDALEILEHSDLNIPFIVVTGSLSEEAAVQCMTRGANDYLLKDRLARLGQAVAKALDDRKLREEKRQAELALRESEHRFRLLAENSTDLIARISPSGVMLYASPACRTLLGYEASDLVGTSTLALVHHDDTVELSRFLTALASSAEPGECTLRLHRSGGEYPWFEMTGRPIRDARSGALLEIQGSFRDITRRRLLEEQLLQSQKMEAIGRLAGSVSHDFGNLITAIVGFSELILAELPEHSPLRTPVEEIRLAGERGAALTDRLLTISRRQVVVPRVLDLNSAIRNVESILRRLVEEDIRLENDLAPGVLMIRADLGQIEQMLMNLVVNSRDAMSDGGTVTIATRNADVQSSLIHNGARLPAGRYVKLSVTDTGCGMDEVTKARVFEPFFTTKEPGKGTGLGLSVVYGVVAQNGGYIDLQSAPDEGATFIIYLPRLDDVTVAEDDRGQPVEVPGGSETVLVVEDDATVRTFVSRALRLKGYSVIETGNGLEALTVFHTWRKRIDLLLTDVIMLGMNGRLLAQTLVEEQPDLRVLFTSGYLSDNILPSSILTSDVSFLRKPFKSDSLLLKVREVLDRPADSQHL